MNSILYIKDVDKKGRGVFSAIPYTVEQIIETCPLLIFRADDFEPMKSTFILNYCFLFDQAENLVCLATGFGSLYNHSSPANARHKVNKEERTVSIIAVREIAAHEEICINYHGDFDSTSTIWFTSKGIEYHP